MRIRQLNVKGYRSLRDVVLTGLGDFTVIYGDNNTGKSNVLAFLEMVFAPKIVKTSASPQGGLVSPERLAERERTLLEELPAPAESKVGGWMRGEIADFRDNFFQNSGQPITFDIVVEFTEADVNEILGDIDSSVLWAALNPEGPLTISGSVSAAENDSALMTVQRLVWGDKTVYAHDGMKVVDAVVSGLPTVVQNTLVVGLTCFLEASVVVINSHRFLSQEVEAPHSGTAFQAGNFKNTLHNLSLSRERHRDFAEIAQLFANEPFTYGNLSFARTDGDQGDNLELMVQSSDELRIPVDRLGSGVQQVLVIIANLVANRKKKVFGLEEPEINLSPRSQVELRNKLMEFINLKSYVHQLFITSHSDIFGPDRGLSVCLLAHDGVETVVISEDERAERLKHHFGYRPSPKYCLYDCPTREQIPKRRRDEACWDCLQYANKDGVTPAEWEKYRGALPGKFGF